VNPIRNSPARRVGEKFDVLDALSQLIEGRNTSLEDCDAKLRRLNAAPATIEKTHAKRVLDVGNCFRNDRC
jgi:predicted nucleic acid-binding Zn ribbon protein